MPKPQVKSESGALDFGASFESYRSGPMDLGMVIRDIELALGFML